MKHAELLILAVFLNVILHACAVVAIAELYPEKTKQALSCLSK